MSEKKAKQLRREMKYHPTDKRETRKHVHRYNHVQNENHPATTRAKYQKEKRGTA